MRWLVLSLALLASPALAQQMADGKADVSVAAPAWAKDAGPVLAIDAAHKNFHTIDGRYAPFAALARNDGFQVVGNDAPFTEASLAKVQLLVMANAAQDLRPDEIKAVRAWVEDGGSLLIADHMPFSRAADGLARAFGFQFESSFAFEPVRGPELFSRANGRLADSPVTPKDINAVYAFTGTVLHAPPAATVVMRLGAGWSILYPTEPWKFDGVPSRPSDDKDLRGALMAVGKGRVAMFSEAAMFSAQRQAGDKTMGFNYPPARQNKAFILNILNWLGGAP
ncbi:DUF4350 domain-containing protein [Caulobacter sp.]|uniref:DUF4350 domain-containing protein n=1 Tax=Caulobacter sp. TaxID=78 RepID=UPI001B0C81FF|nr:DUF4350 domain-containing protein [Caulobacter sp.]MBO9544753.1 hypothetical protein [Caulobacter sp.]